MSSSENQNPKSASEPIDARLGSLKEEPLLQLRSASGHADTRYLAGTSFENSAALSAVADSGMSPLSSGPADLDCDKAIAFYPSGSDPFEGHRSTIVDAVLEQLREARLRRQRPH